MKFIHKCIDCGSTDWIQSGKEIWCAKCGSTSVRLVENNEETPKQKIAMRKPDQESMDAVIRELLSTYKWLISGCVRYDINTKRIVVDMEQVNKWHDMANNTVKMLYEMWNG